MSYMLFAAREKGVDQFAAGPDRLDGLTGQVKDHAKLHKAVLIIKQAARFESCIPMCRIVPSDLRA